MSGRKTFGISSGGSGLFKGLGQGVITVSSNDSIDVGQAKGKDKPSSESSKAKSKRTSNLSSDAASTSPPRRRDSVDCTAKKHSSRSNRVKSKRTRDLSNYSPSTSPPRYRASVDRSLQKQAKRTDASEKKNGPVKVVELPSSEGFERKSRKFDEMADAFQERFDELSDEIRGIERSSRR